MSRERATKPVCRQPGWWIAAALLTTSCSGSSGGAAVDQGTPGLLPSPTSTEPAAGSIPAGTVAPTAGAGSSIAGPGTGPAPGGPTASNSPIAGPNTDGGPTTGSTSGDNIPSGMAGEPAPEDNTVDGEPVTTVSPPEEIICESSAPDEFESNPSVGGGGGDATETPHFRIYGASGGAGEAAGKHLEAAYSCFVETFCWRSSGLSFNDRTDTGPYYKMNIYSVGSLGGAGGQMFSDARSGLSYLKVLNRVLPDPQVTVHEYGHALTYHEGGWVEQTRTGAWWETVANWVADTYLTSALCADARQAHGIAEGETIIELRKVISDAHQVIVDGSAGSGNYYQAWPFLTYLTNNPDNYPGLGATALREMFRNHMGNNETPLHVLDRLVTPKTVQQIVGRYWARMAYLDIGHPKAQAAFFAGRSRLDFANLDAAGEDNYQVKSNRQPKYFGANIIPLQGIGELSVRVSSDAGFTATLAVRAADGAVRYVDLEGGSGQAQVGADEEASLVVVNTPDTLQQYDPFRISGEVDRGLSYQVQITGAAP